LEKVIGQPDPSGSDQPEPLFFFNLQLSSGHPRNRSRVVEANGDTVTWSYDDAYQLTREIRSGANSYAITYSYDPAGNRLTKRDGGSPTTYAYDAANQVLTAQTSAGTTNYSFDANGNQTRTIDPTGARTSWSWDFENRLTGVRLPAGVPNTFTYNADGKRVQRQDSSGTLNGIWDSENLLLETDQSNVTQVIYTLAPGLYGPLVSQFRNAATNFYHFDGIGSTDRLTDINQIVTDSYLYVAFGTIRSSTVTTTNPYRYEGTIGYYYDPDLLQMYLRARHYLPALGRFISRDPAFLLEPELEQLYVYAANDPMILSDPSGLRLCHWIDQLGGPVCDVAGDGCVPGTLSMPLGFSLPPQEPRFPVLNSSTYSYAGNSPFVWHDPSGLLGVFIDGAGIKMGEDSTINILHEAYASVKKYWSTPFPLEGDPHGYSEFRKLVYDVAGWIQVNWISMQKLGCLLEPIDIFGYSRGAVVGLGVLNVLNAWPPTKKWKGSVRFVGLIDPVATGIRNPPDLIPDLIMSRRQLKVASSS
jgi:RHS repeat-associated protein